MKHSLSKGAVVITILIGVVAGVIGPAHAQRRLPPSTRPVDLEARSKFLQVEQFARLNDEQQAKEFPTFYYNIAPQCLSSMPVMILSSYPADILDPERSPSAMPGGDYEVRWSGQLREAAESLTAEQVADNLSGRMWLEIAAHVRAIGALKQRPEVLASLVQKDLDSKELPAVQRACSAISTLHLSQFTSQLLSIYLADTPLSKPAQTALLWLRDPAIVRDLLDQIARDPRSVVRHYGLLQGPLAGGPADPLLLKLLDSPDADIRCHAAYALYECKDQQLAKPMARLAADKDPRACIAAFHIAGHLPADAFAGIRENLAPALSSSDQQLRLAAITCFAKHNDLLAGLPIREMLKLNRLDPGAAVTVMQALNALAGSHFNYDMHNWGPADNGPAIARFEAWLRTQGVGQ